MSNKQDPSGVYNVLAFHFDGKDTAKEAVKQVRNSGALDDEYIIAQIIVEQDEKGKVRVHETGRGGLGAVIGGAAGSILGLFGGPVGFLTWTVSGALVGGVAGKYFGRPFKYGDLKQVGQAMVPDSSAFMLLVEDTYTEEVADSLSGVSASMVTLTVGDELSGELAQFVAGEVDTTDDDSSSDD